MPIVVVGADADHCDARLEHVEQRVRRRRAGTVVGNLEHIDRAAQMFGQPAGEELRIDLLLHVAGEEHPTGTKVKVDHDRLVVDLLAIAARAGRNAASGRPVDVELYAVEPQAIARGHGRR